MPWKARKNWRKLKSGELESHDFPDDPVARCGYFFISTGKHDPFITCCARHDDEYQKKDDGEQPKNRKQVDREFLGCMRFIAGNNKWLRIKANVYYGIVRGLGGLFW
jgi:hypothetical protein